MERQALVILALVAGALSGPITNERRQCAKTCTETSKFNYENGMTYEFGYEADTVTQLTGAAEEHSSLHIRATADVMVVGPCDFELNLRDVRLEESDPRDLARHMPAENSGDFARALEASPLSFSFQDGRVDTLCAADDEAAWVLNIKRGILSAFQNNMEHTEGIHRVHETDVTGNCEAVYDTTDKDGSSVTIKRTKNLLGCTERDHHVTAFQGTPYNANSEIQSLPLVKSDHECLQTLTEGVLQLSQCTEKHVFRPFSNKDNGASTSAVQKLELKRKHKHHNKHPGHHHGHHRRTNMLFEHTESRDGLQMERARAVETLRQVCKSDDIRPKTPQLFAQLTYNLRQLDSMSLSELHRDVHDNRVCDSNHGAAKKFFLDAIPMVGTTASVTIIRDLIMNGHVTGMEADHWLTSLAFIAKPNADMVREIRPLIESAQPTANMLLSVTAMVRTYCRISGECHDNMDVQDMTRRLVSNLGNHCDANEELVLMSLKALGNLGQSNAVATMARCASESHLPINIRVAAMEASRGMSCSNDRRAFLDTFANQEEDSEIRINAYLSAMACPDRHILSVVRLMLEKEEVNQVGSFVWTHLTNLQETNDPFKREIKDIVNDETLKKEFDMDKRKYSRNYEGSMFFDSINTGAKVESNMIWSSKSYMPRSAMMNLTVDLFGHSVNLLEVGGRAEGVEHFIESLFGPKGYFPENAVSTALKRARRSADDDKMNRVKDRFASEAENHARGSVYMKMFGNELRYLNLDANTLTNPTEDINVLDILLKLATHKEVDISKSFMFLDSTITLPTIVGIPMKLAVNGTATVKMAFGGKADLRQMLSSPRSVEIDGYMKPSGSVELSSMMSVDAFVARSGLKMVTTLHTSTEVNGMVSLQDSQVVLAKLNMPKDKVEIMDVQSRFFVVHREAEREQKMITEGRFTKALCTGAGLKRSLGLELCGELEYPRASDSAAPYFPMTGPAGFKVFLNKADSHSAYEFEARLQTVRERHSSPISRQVARLAFNTPGSKVNRELLVDFTLNHADKSLAANLRSPWKKATLNGAVVNEDNSKSASLALVIDETKQYTIQAETKINQRGAKMVLTPVIEVRLHGLPPMTANGNVRVIPGEMATGDITIENVFKKPVTLKGGYDKEVRKNGLVRHSSNIEIRTDKPLMKASGSVDQRDGLNRVAVDVAYTFAGPRHRFRYNGQMKDAESRNQYTLVFNGDLTSTQFPMLEHDLKLSMKQQRRRRFELEADLRYGDDDKTNTRRIVLSHQSSMANKAHQFLMDQTTRLTWKAMNIDFDSKVDHKHNNDEAKTTVMLAYQPNKKIDLDYHIRKESSSPLVIAADASLSYPGRKMILQEKLQEKSSGYAHELMAQWQEGSRLTSTGELIISPKNTYDLRVEINPPRTPSTVFIGSTSLNMDDFSAKMSVAHDGRTYSAHSAYNYEAMKSAKASIDIDYPSRQITVDAVTSIEQSTGEYQHDATVMWDAKRDATKKFSINGRLLNKDDKMEGSMDIAHVARKFNAAFSHEKKNQKYISHGQATWAPGKTATLDTTAAFIRRGRDAFTLETSADFASPIKYLEKLSFNVQSQKTDRMYRNRMNVSWREGQDISTIFKVKKISGWRNVETDMTIRTPFTEDITGAFNLNTLDQQIITHIEGALGNKNIAVDAEGKYEYPSVMEGSIKIKTPLRKVRQAGASIRHNLVNGHLNNNVHGFLNNKHMELAVSGKHLAGRNFRDADLAVLLKTPFTNFEHITGNVRHKNDGRQYTNSFEAKMSEERLMSGSLDFVHELRSNGLTSNGKIHLGTPLFHEHIESVNAEWTHEISPANTKITYQGTIGDQSIKADLSHMKNNNQMASRFVLGTPFQSLRSVIVDGRHANNNGVVKSNLLLSKNNVELFNLDSDVKYADRVVDGKAEVKVIGKTFTVGASLQAENSPFAGHAEFKWGRNNKVAVDGELTKTNNRVSGNIRAITPFRNFERIALSMNHHLAQGKYINVASLEYAPNKKIEVDSTFAAGKEMSLSLKTPCPYIQGANVFLSQERGLSYSAAFVSQAFSMTQDAKLDINSLEDISGNAKFTSSLTNDITLSLVHKKAGNEYHSTSSMEFAPRQKIVVKQMMAFSPDFKADFEVSTPFYSMQQLTTSVVHSGRGARFQNKINFNMNAAGESTSFASSATVHGLNRVVSTLRISHPRMTTVDLLLNHYMSEVNSHSDFTYGPGKKIDLDLSNDNGKVSVALKTPFEALSELKFDGEHEAQQTNIKSKYDVTVVSFGVSGQSSGHIYANGLEYLDSNLVLKTPEDTYTFIAKHGKMSGKWVSTVAISSAPEKTIAIEVNYDPEEQEASVSFNSPIKGLEDLHLLGAAKSERKMKYGKVEFNYNGKTTMVECRVKHARKMMLDLEIVTPFSNMKRMSIKSGASGSLDNFNVNAVVSHNKMSGKVKFDAAIKTALDDFDADIAFTSPFSHLEDLKLKINHKRQGSGRYISSVQSSYAPSKVIELRSQLSLNSLSDLQGQVVFTSPCPRISSFQVAFNHNGLWRNMKTHVEAQLNEDKKTEIDASLQVAGAIRAAFKAITPLESAKNVDFSLYHRGPWFNFQTQSELSYNAEKISASANLNVNNGVQGRFIMSSPFSNDITATINHKGDLLNFQHISEALYGRNKKITLNAGASINDNVNIQVEVSAPDFNVNKAGIVVSQQGPILNFNSGVRAFFNQESVDVKASLNALEDITATFEMLTPFEPIRNIKMEISHAGSLHSFTSKGKLIYAPETSIEGEATVMLGSKSKMNIQVKTPFSSYRNMALNFNHLVDDNGFEGDAFVSHNDDKLVEMTNCLSLRPALKGSFVVKTPYELFKIASVGFNHAGNSRNANSHIVLNFNEMITIGNFTLNNNKAVIRLRSPIPHANDVILTLFGRASSSNMAGSIEFNSDDFKGIKAEAEFKTEPEILGHFAIETPFQYMEKHSADFTFTGSFPDFRGHAELDLKNVGKIQLDSDLSTSSGVNGQIRFQTPFNNMRDYRASINHNGQMTNFNNKVELSSKEHFNMESNANLKLGYENKGQLSFTTDISAIKNFEASFNHKGDMTNFVGHVEANCQGCEKVTLDAKLNPTYAELILQTPFTNVKEYKLVINHEGSIENFRTSVNVASKEHFNVEGNANLALGYKSTGGVSFTSDIQKIKDFSASFNHNGDMEQFRSHAEATCSGCGKVEIDAEFNKNPLRGELKLRTPIRNMKEYSIVINHEGPSDDFVSKVIIASREHFRVESAANLKMKDTMEGGISFTSDIQAIKDFSASFSHLGDKTNFKSHAEATCSNCGKMEIDGEFALSPAIKGEFKFQSPIKNMKMYLVSFKHDGDLLNFASEAKLMSREHFTINNNANLKVANGFEGSYQFKSNIDAISNFDLAFSHAGSARQFRSHLEVNCEDWGQASYDGNFHMGQPIIGNFHIGSPVRGFESLSFNFRHNIDSTNVKSVNEFTYAHGKTIKVTASSKLRPSIDASLKVETPFTNTHEWRVSHSGNMQKFSTAASSLRNGETLVHYDATFDSTSAIEGTFNFQTTCPYIDDLQVTFKHDGKRSSVNSEAEVKYGQENAKVDFTLKTSNGIEADLKVLTPFKHIRDLSASLSHKSWRRRFQTDVSLIHNGQSYEGKINLRFAPNIEGDLSVKTPFSQARDIHVTINHQGEITDFAHGLSLSHNGQEVFNGKLNFKAQPQVEGTLEIKSALKQMRNAHIRFAHSGNTQQFNSHATVSHNGQQKFQGEMSVKTYPGIQADLKVQTPYSAARNVRVTVSHDGSLSRFRSQSGVHYNGQQILDGYMSFNVQPNIRGEMKIKTLADTVSATISHEGSLAHFLSKIDITHNGQKKADGEISFTMQPAIRGELKLKTPFSEYQDISAVVSHTSSRSQIASSASININGYQKASTELLLKMNPSFEVNYKLMTPFASFRELSAFASHSGSLQKFNTVAKASFNGSPAVDAEFRFQLAPVAKVYIKLDTPHTKLQDAGINVNYEGHSKDFAFDVTAVYKGNTKFHTMVKFQLLDTTLKTNFRFNSPYTPSLHVVYNHEGTPKNFRCHAEVNEMKGDLALSIVPGAVSVSLKSTFDGFKDISGNFKYAPDNVLAEVGTDMGKFEAEGSFKQRPLTLALRLASPFKQAREITLDMSHKGNRRALYSMLNLKRNGKNVVDLSMDFKNYARTVGNLNLKSIIPYAERIAMSVRHEHSSEGLKSHGEVTYYNKEVAVDATMMLEPKMAGVLRVTTPFAGFRKTILKVNGVYEQDLVNGDVSLAYGKGQEISVAANFDRKPSSMDVSITLNTPFNAVKSAGAGFKQEGDWTNLETSTQVNLNEKYIKVDGVYREENGIPAKVSVILFTPFSGLEKTSLEASHTKEGDRRNSQATFAWMNEMVELVGQMDGKIEGSYDYHIVLTTPFEILKQFKIAEAVRKSGNSQNEDSQIYYNGRKVYESKFGYKQSGNKHEVEYTMVTPHPMNMQFEFAGVEGDFAMKYALNWDSRDSNKKITTEVTHKLEAGKRLIGVRFITANRITGFKSEYERSSTRFGNKLVLIWDEADQKMVSYDISLVAKPSRYSRNYEAHGRIDTPIRSLEMNLKHKDNSQSYETELNTMWDAARDTSRQLTLRNTYENVANKHKHQLVISHPKMAKDVILRNEWSLNVNDIMYSGRTEIEYSDDASDTLIMSTLVRDHSGNYSVELGLSHPQSKLDVKMNSHVANTDRTLSAGMDVNYMSARRKVTNMSLRGEIEKIKKMLTMEVLTPMKKLQFNGKIKEKRNIYSVNVVATEDEDKQVSAKFNLDTEAQTVDMKAFYSPENSKNMMHLYGKYVDTTSLTMGATRLHNGRQIMDGEVNVDLENQHLLHSKVYWRPDILEDARFALKNTIKQLRQDTVAMYKTVGKAVAKEIHGKRNSIAKAVPDFSPVANYITEETKSFNKDARVVKRSASKMFAENEFYMKTAYRSSARAITAVSAKLNEMTEQLEKKMTEMKAVISQNLQQIQIVLSKVTSEVVEMCSQLCDASLEKMAVATQKARAVTKVLLTKYSEFHANMTQKYIKYRDQMLDIVDKYVEIAMRRAMVYAEVAWEQVTMYAVQAQDMIDTFIAKMMANPRVQRIVAKLNTLASRASSFMAAATESIADKISGISMANINRLHQVLHMHLESMTEKLTAYTGRFLRTASQAFDDTKNFVSTFAQNAIEHENSKRVQALMQTAYSKMSAAYTKFNVETRTKSFVREAVLSVVNFVKRNSYYLVDEFLHLEEDRIIEWDPSTGRIEVQVYIPMEMPSLQSVPFVDVAGAYRRVKSQLISLTPDMDFSVWDTYYKYKPSSDVSNWLPPFKAHATISGRQHYTTFDGKHYEFAAPCSYLLARDFIDGNFSMVVNYDGVRNGVSKRSVTVSTGGREVEIFTNGQVTVDGEAIEMPSSWGTSELTKTDDVLKITDKKGMTVVCDLAHDSCTLHVSGWYFGKMAGLFGTYNNEQVDDFTTAAGQKVTNVAQFASSWAVGRRCSRSRNMARVSPSASSPICASLFHDKNSPLRPCFRIVNPVAFEAMCVNDVMESESASCNVAAHYVAECRRQEVPLALPSTCQEQELATDTFMSDLEEYVGQDM